MRRTRTVLWAVTAVYWVVLFVLTHLPPRRMLSGPGGDKLHHFLAYFVLAFLLGAAMWHAFPARRRWMPILVVIAAAAYAAFDEVTQLLVGRYCELNDWLADVSGASFAAAALYLLQIYFARRARLRSATEPGGPGSTLATESA